MAKLDIPTIRDLYDGFIADYQERTGQKTPLLQAAFVRIFAWIQAGQVILAFRFGRWTYLQMFVSTCGEDALRLYGYRVGIDYKDGSASVATVTLNGVTATSIPSNTVFVSPATGYTYKTSATTSVLSGVANCVVTSDQTGERTILAIGDELSLASPQTGVPDSGLITDVTTEGADPEPIETYRRRVQMRYRMRAQGGSFEDYWLWATEVDGIDDALPYVIYGGITTVYPIGEGSGTDREPTTEKLEEVEASIRQSPDSTTYDRQPVQSELNVVAPLFTEFKVELTDVTLNAATAQNKADMKEAIINYLDSRRPELPALAYSAAGGTVSVLAISAEAQDVLSNASDPGTIGAITVSIGGTPVTSKHILSVGTLAALDSLYVNGALVS